MKAADEVLIEVRNTINSILRNGEEVNGLLLLVFESGLRGVVFLKWENNEEKLQCFSNISRIRKLAEMEKETSVETVVLITEAYARKMNIVEKLSDYIPGKLSEDPKAIEVVLISLQNKDGIKETYAHIIEEHDMAVNEEGGLKSKRSLGADMFNDSDLAQMAQNISGTLANVNFFE